MEVHSTAKIVDAVRNLTKQLSASYASPDSRCQCSQLRKLRDLAHLASAFSKRGNRSRWSEDRSCAVKMCVPLQSAGRRR